MLSLDFSAVFIYLLLKKMGNLDIFVFAHMGNFHPYPNNPAYKLVSMEPIKTDIPWEQIICDRKKDGLMKMEHGYSEGARMHYIWKNVPLKKYVGTAHYRRYFKFFEKVPDMDVVFEEHDAILPKFNLGWPNVYVNYENSHNIADFQHCIDIIKRDFPEFYPAAENTKKSDTFYPCNIFVLTRETFNEYCKFVFDVLDKYNEEMGFKTDLDIANWVVNNLPLYCGNKRSINSNSSYQTRIQAFLMERLSTIFFITRIKNPLMLDLVITEIHEDFEKLWFDEYEK